MGPRTFFRLHEDWCVPWRNEMEERAKKFKCIETFEGCDPMDD